LSIIDKKLAIGNWFWPTGDGENERQHRRSLLRSSSYEGQAATSESGVESPHLQITPSPLSPFPLTFRGRKKSRRRWRRRLGGEGDVVKLDFEVLVFGSTIGIDPQIE